MIHVEVLGRRGQILERIRVDDLPLTIGRAYDCDLILDDPTVSPHHAQLRRDSDGALVLVDLESHNGVFAGGGHARVSRVVLDGGAEVRLGHAALRFRRPDHPVAETQPLESGHPLLRWATAHWSAVLVGGAAVLLVSVWELWRAAFVEIDPAQLAQGRLNALLLMALWAGAWALCGRLLVHAARFVGHWVAVCGYAVGQIAVRLVLSYARFVLAPIAALQRAEALLEALLLAALLWVHLRLATALQVRRRVLVVLVAASLWLAYQELELRQDDTDWVQTLPYWSRLHPIPPRWLPAEPADTFFERARAMRSELDELARELEAREAQR